MTTLTAEGITEGLRNSFTAILEESGVVNFLDSRWEPRGFSMDVVTAAKTILIIFSVVHHWAKQSENISELLLELRNVIAGVTTEQPIVVSLAMEQDGSSEITVYRFLLDWRQDWHVTLLPDDRKASMN